MFRKLVSNLPYNPSLIQQLSFYGRRMKQETSIRRIGFVFIALAMLVQMIAVMAPPEKSLAYSDNHIINGIKTKTDILNAWDFYGSDVSKIYGKFGVTREDIAALPEQPNSLVTSNDGNDWWSVGRNSLSSYSNIASQYKQSEIALKVSSDTTVYMRQLRAWDTRSPYSRYQAFQGYKKSDGKPFWILKDCGNYTQIGKVLPKPPSLKIRKSIVSRPDSLKPGDQFTYRLEYRNQAEDSLAENAFIQDELDLDKFDIVSPKGLPITNRILKMPVGNLAYTSSYKVLDIGVKLKNPLASGTKVCNTAQLKASNSPSSISGPVCVTVIVPCIYNPSKPSNSPDCVKPKLACTLTDADINQQSKEVTFSTKVTATNSSAVSIKSYNYNYGDGNTSVHKSSSFRDTNKHKYKPGKYDAEVTVNYSINGETRTTHEVKCGASVDVEEDNPLGQNKEVKNITQNLEGDKVLGSTVKAGDVIEYSLITTNSQNFDRKDYVVSDYIGDLLDYAELDTTSLKDGGSFDSKTKKVVWKNQTIPADGEKVHTFKIKLKNPIPSTNSPSGTTTSYDCKISNKYGNEITMGVACPMVKGIETLPNTGPGTSLFVGFIIISTVGYFFARSRLLAKEIDLIRTDATAGGI